MLLNTLRTGGALAIVASGVLLTSCVTIEGDVATFTATVAGKPGEVAAFDAILRDELDVGALQCTAIDSEGEKQSDCKATKGGAVPPGTKQIVYLLSFEKRGIFKDLGAAFKRVQVKFEESKPEVRPKAMSDAPQGQLRMTISPGPSISANCSLNHQPCQYWYPCIYKYGYPCTKDKPNCDICS